MILFIAALFLCCLVTLLMAGYALRRRRITGATAIACQMLGLSWWTLAYALQLINTRFPEHAPIEVADPLLWFKLLFLGVVVLPPAFLVFVLQYTGYQKRAPRHWILTLSLVPALVLLSILTEDYHNLFLGDFQPGPGRVFEGGPMFWLHTVYSYLVILIADVLLLMYAFTAEPAQRRQALLLFIATLMPSLANLVTISHILPPPLTGLDLSPFGFLLMVLVLFYIIRREGFLREQRDSDSRSWQSPGT